MGIDIGESRAVILDRKWTNVLNAKLMYYICYDVVQEVGGWSK